MICFKIQIEIPEENESLVLKVNACARQNKKATELPRQLDAVLNGSQLPIGDLNEPFWTALGRHGHLGQH